MNVEWLVTCRYAEVHDNLATIVGGGLTAFWVAEFPTPLSVGFVASLTGTAEEYDGATEHTMRSLVTGPSGESLADQTATFQVGGDIPDTNYLAHCVLPAQVQFVAEQPGVYQFELIVDGGIGKTVALHVQPAEPPAA